VRGHRDLQRACLAAVACALVAALVPLEIVRLVAALPLALFLPGYAAIAAAFGSREPAPAKRLMLSVATSMMVLVLGTFVLNVFPFGLTTASWAVLLPLVVIAACRGAALRRSRPAEGGRERSASLPRPSLSAVAIGAAALAIALAAVALAQKPLPADEAVGFTALWMLPTDSGEEAVAVGVVSNQHHRTAYRLEVSLGKNQSKSYRVKLDPGEEQVYEVAVPPESGGRTHVVATLYRRQRPGDPYRRVTSWLPRQKTLP
jgi:uncharacterized membrane protein